MLLSIIKCLIKLPHIVKKNYLLLITQKGHQSLGVLLRMKNIPKQFVEKYSNAVTDMKKTKILKLPYHSNGKKTERWLERKKKPRTFKSCTSMLNLKCKKITAKKSSVVI